MKTSLLVTALVIFPVRKLWSKNYGFGLELSPQGRTCPFPTEAETYFGAFERFSVDRVEAGMQSKQGFSTENLSWQRSRASPFGATAITDKTGINNKRGSSLARN